MSFDAGACGSESAYGCICLSEQAVCALEDVVPCLLFCETYHRKLIGQNRIFNDTLGKSFTAVAQLVHERVASGDAPLVLKTS